MVKLAGGKPIFTNSSAEDGFKININDLKSKISSKTKFIIINSPNNPTGKVMSKEELLQIADIARENPSIKILSDEIYELILKKDFIHYSLAALANDLKERIFIVNGFAKGWAMTGWRIGYLVGHKDVIRASSALQSQSTSNVCSFVQKGALEALKLNNEFFSQINSHYDQRRKLLYEGLKNINGIFIQEPNGAFYAFPRLPNSTINSVDFCKKILQDYGLVVVPGRAFGADQCVRVSCAATAEKIVDGLNRLKKAIEQYYWNLLKND